MKTTYRGPAFSFIYPDEPKKSIKNFNKLSGEKSPMVVKGIRRFWELAHDRGVKSAAKATMRYFTPRQLERLCEHYHPNGEVSTLSKETDNSIYINYNKNKDSLLRKLCDKHGTDKGEVTSEGNSYPWPSHNYTDFYELIFEGRRQSINTLLECGIGTPHTDTPSNMGINASPGASLRVWRDYFPDAQIVGVDIDDRVLFSEERIETYCVDQTSQSSVDEFFDEVCIDKFDVIIDDGLHEFDANVAFFQSTINYLDCDGLYIIEDVHHNNLTKYREYFLNLEGYHTQFVDLTTPERPHRNENRLIMITPR